jgi:alpha-N-acetylglucosaminidase
MKKCILFIPVIIITLQSYSKNPVMVFPGIHGIIERTVPAWKDKFIIEPIDRENDKDVFEILSKDNKTVLRGSSPVACAYALNWYLKYYCFVEVSQAGKPADLPVLLPVVKDKVHKVTPFQYRYYLNYCTFNYTMSFWDWQEWEKELDWMALNGINLALSVVGTEGVWQNTLRRFNFSESEIFNFMTGPAFQAWMLMGNFEGHGGPVSQKYIDKRGELQKKIVGRMHELGIEPLFHGFYGMVPSLLKQKYPNASITNTGDWNGFKRPDFLNPLDPLFEKMAGVYYEELGRLFGKAKYYGGDPFHEGGSTAGIDVTSGAAKIQQAMQKANPGLTWVLQAWHENPRQELLRGTDKKKVLLLNLEGGISPWWSKTTEFKEMNSVWCYISNYGGRTDPYGNISQLTDSLFTLENGPNRNYVKGIGIISEGIRITPLIFNYFYELAWHSEAPDTKAWFTNYPAIRYGRPDKKASEAWQIIGNTVYSSDGGTEPVFCARPSLTVTKVETWGSTRMLYNPAELLKACQLLFECAGKYKNSDTYLYDLVDYTHLSVSRAGQFTYNSMVKAYNQKNINEFKLYSALFIRLIDLQNRLVSCRSECSLYTWVDNACKQASSPGEKRLFESNALDLITLWGDPTDNGKVHDYAYREWAGLLSEFYQMRWQMFVDYLEKDLQAKNPAPVDFYHWEKNWVATTSIASKPVNTSVIQTVKEALDSITPIIKESSAGFKLTH